MKNIRDAFLRTVLATVLYGIMAYPFIKVGTRTIQHWFFDILIVFVPVLVGMLIYNLTTAWFHKEL